LKINRIASSLALAAAIAIGATGCAMFAPQGTTDAYAPSDGIDVDVAGIQVRNLLLVGDAAGENFNVVFGAVNSTGSAQQLNISFTDASGASTANAQFTVQPGNQQFGDLQATTSTTVIDDTATDGSGASTNPNVQIVSIPGLKVGASATAYLQVGGGQNVQRQVPVLDGTLAEYQRFVPLAGSTAATTEG